MTPAQPPPNAHSQGVKLERGDLRGLDRLRPEAVGLFCLRDVRPIAGVAGFVDWRVCGALSRSIEAETFAGNRGEAMLLAAKSRLGFQRLFVFGLGPVADCTLEVLRQSVRQAWEVMHEAGVRDAIFAAPAAPEQPDLEKRFLRAVRGELDGKLGLILIDAERGVD